MTISTDDRVLPHHRAAAELWGLGGRAYDEVSYAISDALAHAAQRLNPKPGERILDVATGTGWTARNAARGGAEVVGVDISPALLAAARELSAHLRPEPSFELADAERLPFPDGAFDGVISTFGVMFAQDQRRAAAELARVCRPGGRLVVAAWAPGGAVEAFFGLIARRSEAPPPAASPMAWGDPESLRRLLGDAFDLVVEDGVSRAYHDDEDDIWRWYARGFGPVRSLVESLDEADRAAFKAEIDAYHAHYRGEAGLCVRREYRIALGRRRA